MDDDDHDDDDDDDDGCDEGPIDLSRAHLLSHLIHFQCLDQGIRHMFKMPEPQKYWVWGKYDLVTAMLPWYGLSENCVPHCTQWFCWSLPLLNGYFFGGIRYISFSDISIWNISEKISCASIRTLYMRMPKKVAWKTWPWGVRSPSSHPNDVPAGNHQNHQNPIFQRRTPWISSKQHGWNIAMWHSQNIFDKLPDMDARGSRKPLGVWAQFSSIFYAPCTACILVASMGWLH